MHAVSVGGRRATPKAQSSLYPFSARTLVLVLCLCPPALGNDFPDLDAAARRHPRWLQADAAVAEARGRLRQARALANPEIQWLHTRPQAAPGEPTASTREVELRLPLETLVTRFAAQRGGQAALRLAEAEREILRRELMEEAGALWWEGLRLQAEMEITSGLLKREGALARAVEARVQVGELRPVEAHRAWLACQAARVDSIQSAAEWESWSVRAQAWKWTNLPRQTWEDLRRLPLPFPATATDAFPGGHPRLVAAQYRVDDAAASRAQLQGGWSEGLALVAVAESSLGRTQRSLGLGWTLPVLNLKTGERRAARAVETASQAGLDLERRDLLAERKALALELDATLQAARLVVEDMLPHAEQAAEALQKAWSLGEASLFETLEARRQLGECQRKAAGLLTKAHVEGLRLDLLDEREWK
jgi:outer membrane protein TolC